MAALVGSIPTYWTNKSCFHLVFWGEAWQMKICWASFLKISGLNFAGLENRSTFVLPNEAVERGKLNVRHRTIFKASLYGGAGIGFLCPRFGFQPPHHRRGIFILRIYAEH